MIHNKKVFLFQGPSFQVDNQHPGAPNKGQSSPTSPSKLSSSSAAPEHPEPEKSGLKPDHSGSVDAHIKTASSTSALITSPIRTPSSGFKSTVVPL